MSPTGHTGMESARGNAREKKIKTRVAMHWYLKAYGNELTRKERKQFFAWLKKSPANVAELIGVLNLQDRVCARRLRDMSQPPARLETFARRASPLRARNDLLGLALSSTYLLHLRKENLPAELALGGMALLTILAALVLGIPGALSVSGACLGFLATLALRNAVIGYRVSRGLFGSTAAEARLLLRFLIKNSTTIDFDDRNGKPRAVLEPPARPTEGQRIPVGAVTE